QNKIWDELIVDVQPTLSAWIPRIGPATVSSLVRVFVIGLAIRVPAAGRRRDPGEPHPLQRESAYDHIRRGTHLLGPDRRSSRGRFAPEASPVPWHSYPDKRPSGPGARLVSRHGGRLSAGHRDAAGNAPHASR